MAPQVFEIRIAEQLDDSWADWFEGLAIRREENGETLLSGELADQSALQGVLARIHQLGLKLISVNPAAGKGQRP